MIPLSLPERLVGLFLRLVLRPVLSERFPVRFQRFWLEAMSVLNLPPRGVRRVRGALGGVGTVTFVPAGADPDAPGNTPVMLFLHGGGFTLGSHITHGALAGYLARAIGGAVHLPAYGLAPERPWPAGRDDAMLAYRGLLARGVPAERIIVAGDSAGGVMTMDLLLALRAEGAPMPAGAALLSTPYGLDMVRVPGAGPLDPFITLSWMRQIVQLYGRPSDAGGLIDCDVAGLPPLHIQYSEEEVLAEDSRQFLAHLRACGVTPDVRVDSGPFHVIALMPGLLRRGRAAVASLADFSVRAVAAARARPVDGPDAPPRLGRPA